MQCVYVCVCVCVYIYIYIYNSVNTNGQSYIICIYNVHVCIYIYIYTCTQKCPCSLGRGQHHITGPLQKYMILTDWGTPREKEKGGMQKGGMKFQAPFYDYKHGKASLTGLLVFLFSSFTFFFTPFFLPALFVFPNSGSRVPAPLRSTSPFFYSIDMYIYIYICVHMYIHIYIYIYIFIDHTN